MRRLLSLAMGLSFVLAGCNGVGDKETLAIRVENESIYEEDIDLLGKLINEDRSSPKFTDGLASIVTETAVMIKARKEFPELEEMYRKRGNSVEDRLLTYVYQNFYTMECLQIPESDLHTYYYKHKDDFDSTKTFVEARHDVARVVFLQRHRDDFEKFLAEELKNAEKPASASVAYVIADSATVKDIQNRWVSGESLNSVQGVQRADVVEGKAEGLFNQPDVYSMFFGKNTMDVGRVGIRKVAGSSDSFAVIKFLSLTPSAVPDTAKVTEDAESKFIQNDLNKIFKGKYDELVKKFKIEEQPVNPPHLEEYYEAHKDQFMNQPMMDVYAVGNADSAQLARLASREKLNLDYFVQNGTHLGNVKEDHALPNGLGLMPALFTEMLDKPDSTVSTVLRSPVDSSYYIFYVASHTPAQPKPYDRVKAQVLETVLTSGNFELDSDYVLVTKNGEPVIRERDILQIYEEDDNLIRSNRTRTRLVKSLLQSIAFSAEARELKLDRGWEYKSLMRQNHTSFINAEFKRKLYSQSPVPEDSLKALYDRIGNPLRPGVAYEDSRMDLCDMLSIPVNLLKYEFYRFPKENEGKTVEGERPRLFRQLAVDYRRNRWSRYLNDLLRNTNFTIYDNTLDMPTDLKTPERWMAQSDSLYKSGNMAAALSNWNLLRDWYADDDSVFARATLEIAHISSDLEQYETAETEYSIFCYMWPNSPEVEKAMFSRGFILNENLHRDAQALEVLQEFQRRFPGSSLKESVDWLVDNIRSNGKLANDLLKKIESEE